MSAREWRGRVWSVAELSNLTEGAEYSYQCSGVGGLLKGGTDAGYGRELQLRAPPVGPSSSAPSEGRGAASRGVRLAVFGGLAADKTGEDVVKAAASGQRLDAALLLGDMAGNATDRLAAGDRLLDMVQPIASAVPFMALAGDRDELRSYRKFFRTPSQGADPWYSFGMGDASVVMIWTEGFSRGSADGRETAQRQLAWLQGELARLDRREERAKRPWLIVAGHRPLYCSVEQGACGPEAASLRAEVEGLLKAYRVDLYLAAHLQAYERTYPVFNGLSCPAQEARLRGGAAPCGPVHVLNGDAGAPALQYDALPASWTANRHPGGAGYGELTIHNVTHLQYRQLESDGSVSDEFWLEKGVYIAAEEEEDFLEAVKWVAFATAVFGATLAFIMWSLTDGDARRHEAYEKLLDTLEDEYDVSREALGLPPKREPPAAEIGHGMGLH